MRVAAGLAMVALSTALAAAACGSDPLKQPASAAAGAAGAATDADAGVGGMGDAGAVGRAGGAAVDAAGTGGDGGAAAVAVASGTDCNGDGFELDPDQLRRCLLLAGCIGEDDGPTTSECLAGWPDFMSYHLFAGQNAWAPRPVASASTRLRQRFADLGACADVANCDDVYACVGFRPRAVECRETLEPRCDGTQAITCGGVGYVLDCQRYAGDDGACQVVDSSGFPYATCISGEGCSVEGVTACDGDVRTYCNAEGGIEAKDCARFGLTCLATDSVEDCFTPGEPSKACDEPGQLACDGDVKTYCNADGLLIETDCAAKGLTCGVGIGPGADDSDWLDCVPAGCSARRDESDRCSGFELDLHLSGTSIVSVNCRDYGFSTCSAGRCMP